jgi:molecular chaperone GrpE
MKKQKKETQSESQPSSGADAAEELTAEATAETAAETDGASAEATPEQAELVPAELVTALEAELAEAKAAAAAQADQLQRIAAEFQNSKRRQEKQLADAIDRAGSHIIQQLLPVIDDFDLAFNNLPAELTAEESGWVDGFRQIQKKLVTILTDQGLTPIPTEGVFDPNLHEAITSEPRDDVESGHIIQTLRAGYEYKGRVLRPAMVRVAS